MIHGHELRKGNKVLFAPQGKRHHEIKPRICTVKKIEELTVLVDDMGLPLSLFFNSEDLQPIPLTPEILIACGFELLFGSRSMFNVFIDYLEITVSIEFFFAYIDTKWGQAPIEKPIFRYLHQLQNLIHALANQELSYKP